MSSEETRPLLVRRYSDKFGEPRFPEEAYGYWISVAGAALGLLGFVAFLVSTTTVRGDPLFWPTRQAAAVLAGAGLPILMLGVVYRLPVKRRVDRVATTGVLACLVALGAFSVYYPVNWNVPPESVAPDYSTQIATAYAAGVFFVVFSALVLPAVTAVRDEVAAAAPAESKAEFELYEDRRSEWRWRLRHRNGSIIADSGEGYSSKQKAKQGLETVRKNARGAPVEEEMQEETVGTEGEEGDEGVTSESAFDAEDGPKNAPDDKPAVRARYELYEDASDGWRWRLVHEDGDLLADSGEGYPSRSEARRSLSSVRKNVRGADYLEINPAGFEVYRDEPDGWRWRLVHRNGRSVAVSGENYAEPGDATEAVESLRDTEDLAAGFEIYEDEPGVWMWKLSDKDGNVVANSGEGYRTESDARAAADHVAGYVPEAEEVEVEEAYFAVYRDETDEWRWRLVHGNGQVIAESAEGYTDRSDAVEALERVNRHGPAAPVDG